MRVKRISNIIFFVVFALQVYSQDNSTIKIDVGGKSILIPPPADGFVEIGNEERKLVEYQAPKQNKLLAYFLSLEPTNPTKKMTIQVQRDLEFIDYSDNDFEELKLNIKSTFSNDVVKVIKDVNAQFSNIEDIIGRVQVGEMKTLGSIFENADALALIAITNYNTAQGVKKVLGGVSCIRVKDRAIFIYVSTEFENEESLKWVSSTIEGWTKSILSANQEIKKEISKGNSNNSIQNKTETNKESSNNSYQNLFNEIKGLFSTLISKAPYTFICLILLLIAYYIGTRKLFSKYLKITQNQSLIFLYIKKISTDETSEHNLERFFFRLVEFILMLFLLLALLRSVGFPIPPGIF